MTDTVVDTARHRCIAQQVDGAIQQFLWLQQVYSIGMLRRNVLMMEEGVRTIGVGGDNIYGGYFAASVGNITDEIIKQYIENQDLEENQRMDNFTVSGPDKL